jgi:hypothetical protein
MDPQELTRVGQPVPAAGGTDTGPKCPVTWRPDIIRAAIPVYRAAIIKSIVVKKVGWVCSVI